MYSLVFGEYNSPPFLTCELTANEQASSMEKTVLVSRCANNFVRLRANCTKHTEKINTEARHCIGKIQAEKPGLTSR